jgi:hypothetical protein
MAHRLPPDLDRVGDALTAGAARSLAARQRRNALLGRLAVAGIGGALAFAALTPAALGPAQRTHGTLELLLARTDPAAQIAVPRGCDEPRGGRVTLAACVTGEPMVLSRPRRW